MDFLWSPSDVSPILLANVVVNLNGRAAIQCIAAVSLRSRNPIVLSIFHVVVVGLEARALEALKSPSSEVKSATGLGKGHPAYARRSSQATGFALDIHDTTNARFGLRVGDNPKPLPSDASAADISSAADFMFGDFGIARGVA